MFQQVLSECRDDFVWVVAEGGEVVASSKQVEVLSKRTHDVAYTARGSIGKLSRDHLLQVTFEVIVVGSHCFADRVLE
jgi:hypothetical protein